MDKVTYNKLKESKEVIKINYQGGFIGLVKSSDLIISFSWIHKGFKYFWPELNSDERIHVQAFSSKNYNTNLPLPPSLPENLKILVNADKEEYAILYQLDINNDSKEISLTTKEYPVLGLSIMSEDEREGMTITFA